MIKRFIACLTICLIITGLISPVFSDASALPQPNWSDPGISEIINISDLTGWMLNGGTFDVSTYTDAESFMNDYFNARTKTKLVSPGEAAEDYYEVLPGFGINNQLVAGDSFARPLDTNRVIASSFRDHVGYGRRFSKQINDALLSTGHLYDTKIPLLNEVEFANFVNYNHDALRLYSEFFTIDDNSPSPNPPAEFSFLTNINHRYIGNIDVVNYDDFRERVYSNGQYYYNKLNFINPFKYYSFVGENFNNLHTPNQRVEGGVITLYPNLTINLITNQDNSISASYSSAPLTAFLTGGMNYYTPYTYCFIDNGYLCCSPGPTDQPSNFKQSSFSNITNAINYVYQHYVNINLYVDGELWALANTDTLIPPITPEFPDAVGGEDLPSTTWPVHRPLAPYFITAPGMLKAIQDAIDNDGKLDIDDLKPYLTDENGDPVPDPQFDPEPVPIPVPDPVNPDVVPGLPILPAMPPKMPGFNGVSVLAEIINFTNQSLPTALIVTFWGIVFGIVILGLIKILHK